MKRTCPVCGSDDLLEGLRVCDQTDYHEISSRDLRIEMQMNPEALLRKGRASTTVSASMCCQCGHVMLFADPGFASDLKQFNKLKKEAGKLGDPTKHPLFKQFPKSDPSYKYLEMNDKVTAFADWMRKRSHKEKE